MQFRIYKNKIKSIKRLEDNITFLDVKRKIKNERKWAVILNKVT